MVISDPRSPDGDKNHITHLLLGTPLVDPSSDAKKHKLTKCCREVKSWRVFFLSHFIYFSGRLRPDMIKATLSFTISTFQKVKVLKKTL